MIDPGKVVGELKTGMPPMMRRSVIGEWLRDELKNRSGAEIAHYLTSYHYDLINPGFVLTFKFPFELGFLETPISDVPVNGEKDFQQLEKLAADKFAAAFKRVVSADAVSDHDRDNL